MDEKDITCAKVPVIGASVAEPCGDGYIIPEAEQEEYRHSKILRSKDGVLDATLVLKMHHIDAGAFSMNARAYCHDGECSSPGPMILALPGDVVTLTFVNELEDIESVNHTAGLNDFRFANVSNIHTHGLHIDPYNDNVIFGVNPGTSRVYQYRIPQNHLPGCHWYHAHVHGSTSLHVMGGLLGLYCIDVPDYYKNPPTPIKTFIDAEAKRQWKRMGATYMMLSHLSLCSCNPIGTGFAIRPYSVMRELTGDNTPLGAVEYRNSDGSQTSDVVLVNGIRQPIKRMRAAQWYRFEVANGVGDIYLEIEVRTAVALGGGGEQACNMMLMSLDGVFVPSGARNETHVLLAPGSRAGIAIMCDTPGSYYMQSNPMNRASAYGVAFLTNLMTLKVEDNRRAPRGARNAPVLTSDEIQRPNYLQDLQYVSGVAAEWDLSTRQGTTEGGANWLGVGEDCLLVPLACPQIAFGYPESENASRALENFKYRHTGRLCDIEDVLVYGGGSTPHPMHFHVNHFQVVQYSGPGETLANWGRLGDWRDTIPSLPGATRIRHALDEHGGNVMVHCHFLPHEDQGMMDRYWVTGIDAEGNPTDNVKPCSATELHYCDENVPHAAFDNLYPDIGGTCTKYRTSPDEVVGLVPNTLKTGAVYTPVDNIDTSPEEAEIDVEEDEDEAGGGGGGTDTSSIPIAVSALCGVVLIVGGALYSRKASPKYTQI